MSAENRPQLIKYLITGFSSFGLETSLLFLLTERAKLYYQYSNIIAYVVVFWFNFLLNKFWSFGSKRNMARQLILYTPLFIFNLAFNYFMMYLLTDVVRLFYLFSKVIVVGMVVTWNFFLYKKVIYREDKAEPAV
ncbi:MAG: GtrA family protein [Bacillota bacterium]